MKVNTGETCTNLRIALSAWRGLPAYALANCWPLRRPT